MTCTTTIHAFVLRGVQTCVRHSVSFTRMGTRCCVPDGTMVHELWPGQTPLWVVRQKYSELDWDPGFHWSCGCQRVLHVFRRPACMVTVHLPRAWRGAPQHLWQLTRAIVAGARTAHDFPTTLHHSGCHRAFQHQRLEHRVHHTRTPYSGCILA